MSKSVNRCLSTESLADASPDKQSEAIRIREEAMLTLSCADIARMPAEDIQKLLCEFQTHQIELKMQNEELNRVHQELIQSRDDYAKLYNSSPVGYLTLDKTGIIQKTNIAAATLLGCPAAELIDKKLGGFIRPSDQDDYYLFIRNLLAKKNRPSS